MTRKQLEQYKSKKAEIEELKAYISKLGSSESLIGSSTVFDYRSGYPKPQAVVGVDRAEYWKKKERYEKKIEQLQAECEEAERFVEGIEDSLTRRIFRMYFLDGVRQEDIAAAVYMHRSRISLKISDFFKKEHKEQKEMV
ncbi:MAG: hypothetical protein HDR14_13125 [Lachnospiraceae bacterium]|nr:hypothetical protein [Lachnospiraceae bacterium]